MDWHASSHATTSSHHRQDVPRTHQSADDHHRRPSTSTRPPLPVPPHHRGRILNPQGRQEDCKLVCVHDKQPIYRFRGICPEPFSSFNVTVVRDPRDRDKIGSKTLSHDIANVDLKLDVNYVGIPDQREVAIYNLNDNVNETLLRKFCQKAIDPKEVMVCYHPTSRKHMKMALVECQNSSDARKFTKYANETELMGSKVTASLDPLADQLNSEFNKRTGFDLPSLPRRLKDVGNVLEILRQRLREATIKSETTESIGSSPMDCESEGLSPIDVDIVPSTSAIFVQPIAPPSSSPAQPKKVRSRPSRFSDSPDISRRPTPTPLVKALANLRTPSFHDSSSVSPATPIALSRFQVPPSPMTNSVPLVTNVDRTRGHIPLTSQMYPHVYNPPVPPAMPSTPTPHSQAAWDNLPPPPPIPISKPAGQVTPTPADPTLPEKEMKEKRKQSEKIRRGSATVSGTGSASNSSSSEDEHESRRRSKKKHSRSYRRHSGRRKRRSRNSSSSRSVSSESSISSTESGETSFSGDVSDDDQYHRDRRRHSHRYSLHKRSESTKRKVTEKIVTHKRQVITSKDASTVKDTYIHIVSRRFEKNDTNPVEGVERTSPDSDDLPTISECNPSSSESKQKANLSTLDFSAIGVLEDVSSDDDIGGITTSEKPAERWSKDAPHTWSSTSDTAASTPIDAGERRRRSQKDSPTRKNKKSKRSSGSPKHRRSHKESKRRREKSLSPVTPKEFSKPSIKKKCFEQPPPNSYPPLPPSNGFAFPPSSFAYAPPLPKFDSSKPPPNFYPSFIPPLPPMNILMGQPPPPLGPPPPYAPSTLYQNSSPEKAPANDLTSRLAELFPEQMQSEILKDEQEITQEDPPIEIKVEKVHAEEEIHDSRAVSEEPPSKKPRTRKSRFDVVASPPPMIPLPPCVDDFAVADYSNETLSDVEERAKSVREEVFMTIRSELQEQILKDLLKKRDTYTFEEFEVQWDRLAEELKDREKEEPKTTEETAAVPQTDVKSEESTEKTTESSSNWAIGFESMFRSTSLRLLPRIQKVKNPAAIAAMNRRRRRRRQRSRSAGDVSRGSSDTDDRDGAMSRISSTDSLDSSRNLDFDRMSPISEKSVSPGMKSKDEEEEIEQGLMSSGQEDNDDLDSGRFFSRRISAVPLDTDVSGEEEDEEEGEYESSVEGEDDLLLDVETVEPMEPFAREKRVSRRNEYVEEMIGEMFKLGVDDEDIRFLHAAYNQLIEEEPQPFGRPVLFGRYPEIPPVRQLTIPKKTATKIYYFDDPELEGVAPHKSGCARTEGYYRVSNRVKKSLVRRPEEESSFKDKTEISAKDETSVRQNNTSRRELKAANRRNQTIMGEANTDMFKINQLKFRKKMIKFARSKIHGWGLYAMEAIGADEMIVEYVGELVRPVIADEREKSYEKRGIGSSYLFRIDKDSVIDATKKGNFARFINHSCQPNCYARVVTLEGQKRIVIYSKTMIRKGDEITYDYKFPIEEEKIECLCGAPQCRRFLN